MSQTTHIMVAKSISQKELASIENQRVELNGLDQSRHTHSTASSNTRSGETLRLQQNTNSNPSKDPNRSSDGNPRTW